MLTVKCSKADGYDTDMYNLWLINKGCRYRRRINSFVLTRSEAYKLTQHTLDALYNGECWREGCNKRSRWWTRV